MLVLFSQTTADPLDAPPVDGDESVLPFISNGSISSCHFLLPRLPAVSHIHQQPRGQMGSAGVSLGSLWRRNSTGRSVSCAAQSSRRRCMKCSISSRCRPDGTTRNYSQLTASQLSSSSSAIYLSLSLSFKSSFILFPDARS